MEEKPLIFVFTSFYKPRIGGAELAAFEIMKRLAGDFEFHVITHRLELSLPKLENDNGILIHRVGFGTELDRMFLSPFLFAFKGFFLIKSISQRKVIMWGIMVSYASIGAFFIKLFKKNIPFLLTIQEGDLEWNIKAKNFGQASIWWRLIFKKVDRVTAISSFLAGIIDKAGFRGSVDIIPNGVDERLLEIKRSEMPRLAGGQAAEKIIFSASRLVEKNGLDIFARPSRSEGLGSAFLEAMAAGLITIGTPVGGITDFLFEGKTGFLAKPNDDGSLAKTITTALTLAPEKKDQIVNNARNLVKEKFLWNDIALKMKAVFNSQLAD